MELSIFSRVSQQLTFDWTHTQVFASRFCAGQGIARWQEAELLMGLLVTVIHEAHLQILVREQEQQQKQKLRFVIHIYIHT